MGATSRSLSTIEILCEAKILAAQQGLSVSAFLRRELSRLVEDQRGFVKARESAVRRLATALALGGGPLPSRDDLTTVPSFVDTNVLVYAEDRDAGHKHDIARDLVIGLWNDRTGVLSVQVLQELYVTLTRKLRRPMPPARAAEIVREYLAWRVIDNDGELLVAAMTSSRRRASRSGTLWSWRPQRSGAASASSRRI